MAPPMISVHPRRASGEPWLACHLQTGFAVDFQRSGAHVPGALGSHSSVLLRLAKKPIHTGEGAAVPGDRARIEVSELRVDRAAVLSAGSTFAPFHLRPRIRHTSGRTIGSTPPLPNSTGPGLRDGLIAAEQILRATRGAN